MTDYDKFLDINLNEEVKYNFFYHLMNLNQENPEGLCTVYGQVVNRGKLDFCIGIYPILFFSCAGLHVTRLFLLLAIPLPYGQVC